MSIDYEDESRRVTLAEVLRHAELPATKVCDQCG